MDEDKLKDLLAKIKYFRKIGKEKKAMQLEAKIKKIKAKAELKEEVGPTKVGQFIKKVKTKVTDGINNVGDVVGAGVTAVKDEIEKKKNK